jgi:O-antigen ligase
VATALLAAGLVAVVVAALPYKLFELDRYFVPKELVLHLVALAAAMMLVRLRDHRVDAVDAALALFIAWSALSALLATNPWAAQRATGVSVSGAVVFWAARRVGSFGGYRPLLLAAAIATVAAAVLSLVQAYGVQSVWFSLTRAPGGTFGNRNFVAHFCAIGLPALVCCTVTARSAVGTAVGACGTILVTATLVLTRTRAAWLAILASAVVLLVPLLLSRRHWSGRGFGGRAVRVALAAGAGGIVAIAIPNALNWRSDSPYLESARGLVDYSSGSGRGRVAQYRNSLRMAADNPLFGVGPGNWPVHYPGFAPPDDRSLSADGMAANPWPSSDWVAHLSERGIVATMALLGVFASLFIGGCLRWRELGNPEIILAKLALLGTVTVTMVVSAFDAVLLLAAPAMLAWCVLGAVSGVSRRGRVLSLSRRTWGLALGAVVAITAVSAVRSTTQWVALASVGTGGSRAGWIAAAAWDPGSYRINLRVAEIERARGRCAVARGYARQALDLFPHAAAPKELLWRCR